MKDKLIMWLVGTILERIGEDDVRKWLMAGIELLRAKVIESPNKYDDMVILPMLNLIESLIDPK